MGRTLLAILHGVNYAKAFNAIPVNSPRIISTTPIWVRAEPCCLFFMAIIQMRVLIPVGHILTLRTQFRQSAVSSADAGSILAEEGGEEVARTLTANKLKSCRLCKQLDQGYLRS